MFLRKPHAQRSCCCAGTRACSKTKTRGIPRPGARRRACCSTCSPTRRHTPRRSRTCARPSFATQESTSTLGSPRPRPLPLHVRGLPPLPTPAAPPAWFTNTHPVALSRVYERCVCVCVMAWPPCGRSWLVAAPCATWHCFGLERSARVAAARTPQRSCRSVKGTCSAAPAACGSCLSHSSSQLAVNTLLHMCQKTKQNKNKTICFCTLRRLQGATRTGRLPSWSLLARGAAVAVVRIVCGRRTGKLGGTQRHDLHHRSYGRLSGTVAAAPRLERRSGTPVLVSAIAEKPFPRKVAQV